MALLETDDLLDRFGELLAVSIEVDIAVAWIGPGLAVERLLEHAHRGRIQVRIAVGLSGNATEPATLRRLMAMENVELRVAPAPRSGVFHPKFYRFREPQGTVYWVGSANFTRGGFGGNTELMYEFKGGEDADGDWFNSLWLDLDEHPEQAIVHYERYYRPPKPGGYSRVRPVRRDGLPRLKDIETWDEFVTALRVLDEYCHHRQFDWDVLGETYSYLHTIGVGHEIARRGNWEDFSRRDRNILLGLGRWDNTGAWGLLGDLGGAGTVVGAFTPPGRFEARSYVLEQIQNVTTADEAGIAEAAELAVAKIRRQLHRFGPAAATRFLALAFPGRLVSVNGPSAAGLGAFADMRQDEDHLARNYGAVLKMIHGREWFHTPEPANSWEREIWRCRVALVDAFVYIPSRKA